MCAQITRLTHDLLQILRSCNNGDSNLTIRFHIIGVFPDYLLVKFTCTCYNCHPEFQLVPQDEAGWGKEEVISPLAGGTDSQSSELLN